MSKLKVAVIGCGRIFEMHGNAIDRFNDVELVAVCDCIESRAHDASSTYGGRVYTDYKVMLESETIDVVHLCLPHYLHSVVGMDCAKKGVHVLTEKPVDINVARARELINTCDEENVKLGVIFQNRYRKTNMNLYSMLQTEDFGAILGAKMSLTWKRTDAYYESTGWKGFWDTEGGGVIIDQAIHTLDFLNWTFGGDIDYVIAHCENRTHEFIEVEDIAEGIIRYKDGFDLTFSAYNYYSYDAPIDIEIHTEKAVLKMIGSELEVIANDGTIYREDIDLDEILENQIQNKAYWGTTHFDQIKEFYEYVRGERDSILVDGHEALKTQKLVEAIYESSRRKEKVLFSEL